MIVNVLRLNVNVIGGQNGLQVTDSEQIPHRLLRDDRLQSTLCAQSQSECGHSGNGQQDQV